MVDVMEFCLADLVAGLRIEVASFTAEFSGCMAHGSIFLGFLLCSFDSRRQLCINRLENISIYEADKQPPAGATDAVLCEHHAKGGEGAVELAEAVVKATETPPKFEFLYELDLPIKVGPFWQSLPQKSTSNLCHFF